MYIYIYIYIYIRMLFILRETSICSTSPTTIYKSLPKGRDLYTMFSAGGQIKKDATAYVASYSRINIFVKGFPPTFAGNIHATHNGTLRTSY